MSGPIFLDYNTGMGVKYPFSPAFVRDRAPTVQDIKQQSGYYPIPSLWVHFKDNNPTDSDLYGLVSLDMDMATWILLGTATGMSTELQGDNAVIANPDGSGIIYLVGAAVAQATNGKPLYFAAGTPNANSVTLQIQYAGNPASTQASAAGIASFSSSMFSVDSVGFVTLLNGLYAAALSPDFGMDVVPDANGVIAIHGQAVAPLTVPIRTAFGGVNQLDINLQRSSVGTAGNPDLCGISYFSSSDFTITADGFVELAGAGGGGIQDVETDDGAPNVVPIAGTIQILGGTGITVTGQGPGNTVTIDNTGQVFSWLEVNVNTAMAVETGYITNAAGSLDMLLPATMAVGERIRIVRKGAGGVVITQNAAQTIFFGSASTTPGVTGTLTSGNRYDAIEIVCVTADTDFVVISSVGATWTPA